MKNHAIMMSTAAWSDCREGAIGPWSNGPLVRGGAGLCGPQRMPASQSRGGKCIRREIARSEGSGPQPPMQRVPREQSECLYCNQEHVWQPLLKTAKLKYRKPHSMRHSFAAWTIEGNEEKASPRRPSWRCATGPPNNGIVSIPRGDRHRSFRDCHGERRSRGDDYGLRGYRRRGAARSGLHL
jgi:hypothetical protein